MGCPEDQATLATKVLIDADLKGIDSHGIDRLPPGHVNSHNKF